MQKTFVILFAVVLFGGVARGFEDCESTVFSQCGGRSLYCESYGDFDASPRTPKEPSLPEPLLDTSFNVIKSN